VPVDTLRVPARSMARGHIVVLASLLLYGVVVAMPGHTEGGVSSSSSGSSGRRVITGTCPLPADPVTGGSKYVEDMTSSGDSWHGGWHRTGEGEWKAPPPKPEPSDPEQLKNKAGFVHKRPTIADSAYDMTHATHPVETGREHIVSFRLSCHPLVSYPAVAGSRHMHCR
jgi:hypothetical protein